MASGRKLKEIDLDEQIEFLKSNFFHGFDDHELKQFLQVSKWLRVPANTVIIKEDTTERAFYILVRGEVRVEKRLPGKAKPIQLTTLATGDCFGEMALVTDKRTAACGGKHGILYPPGRTGDCQHLECFFAAEIL
jgi:CRP-like cAMP-binding protein